MENERRECEKNMMYLEFDVFTLCGYTSCLGKSGQEEFYKWKQWPVKLTGVWYTFIHLLELFKK